jgi:hypothetical protein
MFIRKNTSESLKIQIQDLPEELGKIGQMRELSAEDLNLVAGGFSHQCISAATDM